MNDDLLIDQLAPSASAQWMGERFARVVDPTAGSLTSAAVWLFHQLQQGHTCLDFDLPVHATRYSAKVGDERDILSAVVPASWLTDLAKHPHVQYVQPGSAGSHTDSDKLLVLDGRKLFLATCRHDEIQVASALRARATKKCAWHQSAPATTTSPAEQAIAAIRRNQLTIVTGGPGTGKTTIASRMVAAILSIAPVEVALVAPTGKAAKRLENSMRRASLATITATTIHAALYARGEHALANKRLVIADESSMIDLELMRKLLEAIHPDASLVLLGDAHQLASVEAGSVFADILPGAGETTHPLSSCTVRLTENYRFPADGIVARVAAAVNDGAWDRVRTLLNDNAASSVRWHVVSDSRGVVDACFAAFKSAPESRVLCGHRRGRDGSLAINRMLAKRVGGASNPDAQDGDEFAGRPIIVTVNDEVTGVRNGDTGVVQRNAQGELEVLIDGMSDPLPLAQLPQHEAAYALTIHKSQGSEYERVIVVLPAHPSPVVTRELLYTAITRTTGDVLIIATAHAFQSAVEQRTHRASGLRDRMSV